MPLLQQTCWKLPLDCFPRKIHEWKCALIYCVQHIPDGRGRVIVMHSEFSLPLALLLALKAMKHNAAHAWNTWDVAWHVKRKQTALNEIRLDEHDWSQTNNLCSLLVSVALTSDTWPD